MRERCLAVVALLLISVFGLACPTADHLCGGVTCSGHGLCVISDGAAVCVCEDGYLPSGANCTPDPCVELGCVHGTCRRSDAGVTCACELGYAGQTCEQCADAYRWEQLLCVPVSSCDDLHCIHGECRVVDGAGVCVCEPSYDGELCDACALGYHPVGLQCLPDIACDPDPDRKSVV